MGMSREIKFRAGVKRKNELIYLKGFRYSGNEKIKITFADEDKDDCTYTFLNKDVCLEQYTGLQDKNGVEIYEGDIVRWINSDGESVHSVVEFVDGAFRVHNVRFTLWDYLDNDTEVIGNIHDDEIIVRMA